MLGNPKVFDRLIQQALIQVLESLSIWSFLPKLKALVLDTSGWTIETPAVEGFGYQW
jgi:hypothetical protein